MLSPRDIQYSLSAVVSKHVFCLEYGMTDVPEYKRDTKTLRLVGMRIREAREQRGWSQEKLAEVAGMHDRTIGKIDRGQMNLSVLTLLKICKALNCSPNRLLDA